MKTSIKQGGALFVAALCIVTAAAQPAAAQTSSLPTGWTSRDVGNPIVAGSAVNAAGTFTVRGAGANIGGSADQFQFAFQQASGDLDIRVRVTGLDPGAPGVRAGVMIREGLTTDAKNAFVFVSADQGLAMQWRSSANRKTTQAGGAAATAPVWVRLVRQGNVFTGYRSANGTAWTVTGSTTIALNPAVLVGLAVTSRDPYQAATATFSSLAFGSSPSLPTPWVAGDVGSPAVTGSAAESAGTFTVNGAGQDIGDIFDQFQFVYQPISGDTQIVAWVSSLQGADPAAKAGVMIRESLTGWSTHAAMLGTAASGALFQRRLTGGGLSYANAGTASVPGWVRLVREGNLFSAYQSQDGSQWTLVGTDTIIMPATVYVGLAVSSRNTAATATALLSNVAISTPASTNKLPTVALSSPVAGASYTAPAAITISAVAGDVDGSVARVDFFSGTQFVGSDLSSPYSVAWSNVAAGTYSLTAVATDDSGATATSAPVNVTVAAGNSAPTVVLTSPLAGTSYTAPAGIVITAAAADSDGTVSKVDFYVGTTLVGSNNAAPFSVTLNSVAAGTYTLTAVATDNGGATAASAAVNVTVAAANKPPTVSVTAPTAGSSFTAPASITITAAAADTDGTVSKVDFYAGTTLVGSDNASPYSVTWSVIAAGSYSLTAVATDNAGATTASAPISVTIGSTTTPATLVFVTPTDYATNVTSCTLQMRRAADGVTVSPIASQNLGKPAVVAGEVTVDISSLVNALPIGSYYAVIVTTGPGGSTVSSPSPAFSR